MRPSARFCKRAGFMTGGAEGGKFGGAEGGGKNDVALCSKGGLEVGGHRFRRLHFQHGCTRPARLCGYSRRRSRQMPCRSWRAYDLRRLHEAWQYVTVVCLDGVIASQPETKINRAFNDRTSCTPTLVQGQLRQGDSKTRLATANYLNVW